MVEIRGTRDDYLQALANALEKYQLLHPDAQIAVYRQNSVSIRARVVDPDFDGVSKADRHDTVWGYIKDLPEEQQSEISLLLPLTPDEEAKSFANEEFENPIPSRL